VGDCPAGSGPESQSIVVPRGRARGQHRGRAPLIGNGDVDLRVGDLARSLVGEAAEVFQGSGERTHLAMKFNLLTEPLS
jgi:hypothetical protein